MSLLNKKTSGNDQNTQANKNPAPAPASKNEAPNPSDLTSVKKGEEFIYSCPTSESYSIHLSKGTVKAKVGVLKVNKQQHEEIQELIASGRPDIAQSCLLLDPVAAEAIAKQHMEAEANRNRAARGMTSSTMSLAKQRTFEGHNIPDKLSELKVIEEGVQHAEDSNLNPDGSEAGAPFQE